MNFVFISPHFPHTYWQFCDRLHRNGVNVLGIGDAPYDGLEAPLKAALTEYYRVDSLEDYDQVYRAVAFFTFRYGKIDWIESMNEYWLEQDARLRTDFNVTTGIRADRIRFIKEKSLMKQLFLDAGIPTARQHVVSTVEAGLAFGDGRVSPDREAEYRCRRNGHLETAQRRGTPGILRASPEGSLCDGGVYRRGYLFL